MIGRLNHVAIAVTDLAAASALYRDMLGAKVSEPVPQPGHGVTTVFIELPNTKVELIAPLDAHSPLTASSSAIRSAASTISATRCQTSVRPAATSLPRAPAYSAARSPRSARTASR